MATISVTAIVTGLDALAREHPRRACAEPSTATRVDLRRRGLLEAERMPDRSYLSCRARACRELVQQQKMPATAADLVGLAEAYEAQTNHVGPGRTVAARR